MSTSEEATGDGSGGIVKFAHKSLLTAVSQHLVSLFLAAIHKGATTVKVTFNDFNMHRHLGFGEMDGEEVVNAVAKGSLRRALKSMVALGARVGWHVERGSGPDGEDNHVLTMSIVPLYQTGVLRPIPFQDRVSYFRM